MRTLEDLYIQKYDIINLLKICMEKKNKKRKAKYLYMKSAKKKRKQEEEI